MLTGRVKDSIWQRSVGKKINKKRTNFFLEVQNGSDTVVWTEDSINIPDVVLKKKLEEFVRVQLCSLIGSLYPHRAIPFGLSVQILLPEDTQEQAIRFLMDCLCAEADRIGLQIQGVQVECSPAVIQALLAVTVLGKRQDDEKESCKFIAGKELVFAGSAGAEGALLLAQAGYKTLSGRFSERYIRKLQELYQKWVLGLDLDIMCQTAWNMEKNAGIHLVGRSGLFGALWDMSSYYNTGFSAELPRFPIWQETVEVCELFDVNPYKIPSGGCLLIAAEHGQAMVDALMRQGILASTVGMLEEHMEKRICMGEQQQFLSMPEAVFLGKNAPEGMKWIY